MTTSDEELQFMRMAVDEAKKSVPERSSSPRVGAVIVRDGVLLGAAFRGELGEPGKGDHAEYCLLEGKLRDVDLRGATLYTTLEPCTVRGAGKTPCATRIIDRGISEVVIGTYDPNPRIYRVGWRVLRDGGIRLRDFPKSLRDEIRTLEESFIRQYLQAEGDIGVARFDYTKNNGLHRIVGSTFEVRTAWSTAGHGVIHAYSDGASPVAHARFANEFAEIDDPGAYDFSSRVVTVRNGDIVIFSNADGYALVQIRSVLAGPERGDDIFELTFDYQLRSKAALSGGG
jgi:diaminohydroxyphosphoribosylaminopyrimidine deaminase/5-amino-6-(5-phosphoribosylamino)uracil reductase